MNSIMMPTSTRSRACGNFRQSSLGVSAQPPYPDAHERNPGRKSDQTIRQRAGRGRHQLCRPAGATVGLLGGNGAGKTTTIAMLLGLLVPTSGRITVLGHDMAKDRFTALARMNFSSPYVALPARLTVRENMRVYGHLYNVPQGGPADRRAGARTRPGRYWTGRPASCPPGKRPASHWRRR